MILEKHRMGVDKVKPKVVFKSSLGRIVLLDAYELLVWLGGWLSDPHDLSVIPSPLGTNLGFELGWTGLGLGLGGLGSKG